MTTVAFIGLGVMGRPMAKNLLAAGHELVVFNRSQGAVDELVADGARAAATAADAASSADAVVLCLPDTPDVESVLLGPQGVLASMSGGGLVADCSTIRPDATERIAAAARDAKLLIVDAPVSGGEKGAIDGTLSIMVGGTDQAFTAARPYLEVVGSTIVHVGASGSGQTVKAANQLLVGGIIGLVSEAILLLEAQDVDLTAALEVLAGGLAGNRILDRKAATMVERRFEPGFRIDLHHKDLGILLDAARDAGCSVPLGGLVAQLMTAAVQAGDGSLDHSGLLRTFERLGGSIPRDQRA